MYKAPRFFVEYPTNFDINYIPSTQCQREQKYKITSCCIVERLKHVMCVTIPALGLVAWI